MKSLLPIYSPKYGRRLAKELNASGVRPSLYGHLISEAKYSRDYGLMVRYQFGTVWIKLTTADYQWLKDKNSGNQISADRSDN